MTVHELRDRHPRAILLELRAKPRSCLDRLQLGIPLLDCPRQVRGDGLEVDRLVRFDDRRQQEARCPGRARRGQIDVDPHRHAATVRAEAFEHRAEIDRDLVLLGLLDEEVDELGRQGPDGRGFGRREQLREIRAREPLRESPRPVADHDELRVLRQEAREVLGARLGRENGGEHRRESNMVSHHRSSPDFSCR